MPASKLPPISTIPSLPTSGRAAILDTLFEPCTQLHTLSVSTLASETFSSYPGLIAAVTEQLRTLHASDLASDREWLDAILSAHPRLGEKKVRGQSKAEQAGLEAEAEADGDAGYDGGDELTILNLTYESTFPGIRYVTFVNGRPRAEILADMRKRISRSDADQERKDAIRAMGEIATDRAGKLERGEGEDEDDDDVLTSPIGPGVTVSQLKGGAGRADVGFGGLRKRSDTHKDENVKWEKELKRLEEEEGLERYEPLAL